MIVIVLSLQPGLQALAVGCCQVGRYRQCFCNLMINYDKLAFAANVLAQTFTCNGNSH